MRVDSPEAPPAVAAPPEAARLIVNPVAGRGAALRAADRVTELLARGGVRVELLRTAGRGHAADLAQAAAEAGWPAVVSLGGDGTVHEVANGLLRAAGDGEPVPLGIVPVGSGNDFARLAGVPGDPWRAARAVLSGARRRVDVGRFRVDGGPARHFTNGVGTGLDARVAIEANRNRRLRGIGIYLWALARVLRDFRPPRLAVTVDGRALPEAPRTMVTVANGARHGGGFWIAPDAAVDDGVLDVAIVAALGRLAILRFLPRVMNGSHVGIPAFSLERARRVSIASPDPLPVHADGEIIAEDAHALDIELLPLRLTILGASPPAA